MEKNIIDLSCLLHSHKGSAASAGTLKRPSRWANHDFLESLSSSLGPRKLLGPFWIQTFYKTVSP